MPTHVPPLSALLCAVALSLASATARADKVPDADEWPVERNAQILSHREWKVGLFGFDGGIANRLQVGTLWLSWFMLSPNIHTKLLLVRHNGWQLTSEISFFTFKLDHLGWFGIHDIRGRFSVLPVELYVDKRVHERVLLGMGAGYVFSQSSPQYDPKQFDGSGAYDSFFVHGHVTVRASPHLWLVAELDWVLDQTAGAVGSVSNQIDAFTTVNGQVKAAVKPLEPARGGAGTVSIVVRADRFGMRLGVGYGNLVVPRVRIVVPQAIPYFTADFFARFGRRRDRAHPPQGR